MAIIEEEVSSDESDVASTASLHDTAAAREPRTDKGRSAAVTLEDTPLQRLIGNKQQSIDQETIADIVEANGYQATLLDTLRTATLLTKDSSCDELKLTLLERVTKSATILVFLRHDSNETIQADLSIGDDHAAAAATIDDFLQSMAHVLRVPDTFLKRDDAITPQDSQKQTFWLAGASGVLELLDVLLKPTGPLLPVILHHSARQAQIAITCARFRSFQLAELGTEETASSVSDYGTHSDESWTTKLSSETANRILSHLAESTGPARVHEKVTGYADNATLPLNVIKHILLEYIKPLFSTTPHPMLNPETGRKLDRQRGGELFADTHLDGDWKGRNLDAGENGSIGCWKVYLYCLSILQKDDFEQIWPWLVPPMMTLLDDHDTYFRHQGIIAVSYFLLRAPVSLIRRTGLDQLILKSLTITFTFTSSSDNVLMIHDAVVVSLRLVNLLYPASSTNVAQELNPSNFTKRSKQSDPPGLVRFNTLCDIYRQSVMSIFTYSSSNFHFMTLAFSVIPLIIAELGKGSIRYLSDTMPVLCASLGGSPASKALSVAFTDETVEMHIAAAEAIQAYINVAAGVGRIARWRGMILSAIATLWCNVQENRQQVFVSTVELEAALRQTVLSLRRACPEQVEVDIKRVQTLDSKLFTGLFALPT